MGTDRHGHDRQLVRVTVLVGSRGPSDPARVPRRVGYTCLEPRYFFMSYNATHAYWRRADR
jgi:hypothetical protein